MIFWRPHSIFWCLISLRLMAMIALFALVGCTRQSGPMVLKMGHGLSVAHPVHSALVFMRDELRTLSGGQMDIAIYPSGQLGGERDMIELLQIGSLAMTKVSANSMESFVPDIKIFNLPYVFRDESHLWQVLESDIGRALLLRGEAVYLRGLAYYDAGSRSFYTRDKPVYTPADLAGLKIRVMKSATAVDMVNTLGGAATPIAFGELYTALQQGVVDGAENNAPSFYLSRHYDVAKYYSLDRHTFVPDMVMISSHIWAKLSPRQQAWLQQAADKSVAYQRDLWRQSARAALAAVIAAGVTVIEPDAAAFRAAAKPLHDQYAGTAVHDLIRQIDRIGRD